VAADSAADGQWSPLTEATGLGEAPHRFASTSRQSGGERLPARYFVRATLEPRALLTWEEQTVGGRTFFRLAQERVVMANSSLSNPPHLNQAKYVARNAATSRWMTALARLGYACKGVVYLLIGVFAVQLALGDGGKAPDNTTALQAIYVQPFGKFLLIVVMIGLCGFVLWSLIQAIFDTEGKGRKVKGIIARLGYAGVAVAYAALAYGAYSFVEARYRRLGRY